MAPEVGSINGATLGPVQFGLVRGVVWSESQLGMIQGFRQVEPIGTPDPEGLKTSAVALTEMLTVVRPNIFPKIVGIALL